MATPAYKLAVVICELFCFEKPYMDSYFGDYNEAELTERCFKGLLLHDFGYNIIRCNLGKIEEITSLSILKKRIYTAIKTGKQIGDAE